MSGSSSMAGPLWPWTRGKYSRARRVSRWARAAFDGLALRVGLVGHGLGRQQPDRHPGEGDVAVRRLSGDNQRVLFTPVQDEVALPPPLALVFVAQLDPLAALLLSG